jgi:phosphoribosyl 1,2-cyclic phosphate phosphodiesterase
MKGADIFIVDALRYRPHPTHFSIEQATHAAQKLAPGRAYFTHIAHDLDHAATSADLPPGIELAYDGLQVEF